MADIEYKISYLMELKNDNDLSLQSMRKRRLRQRFIMLFVSLAFLVIYYLNIKINEFSLLGLKIQNIDFNKLVFLTPVLMTFLFSYYTVIKIRETMVSLKTENILDHLEELIGVKRKPIYQESEYVNPNNTLYKVSERDSYYKLGVKTTRLINWVPFVYAYILSAIHGSKVAINSIDIGFKYFYFITLFLCLASVVIMQITSSFSFRKGKIVDANRDKKTIESITTPFN